MKLSNLSRFHNCNGNTPLLLTASNFTAESQILVVKLFVLSVLLNNKFATK